MNHEQQPNIEGGEPTMPELEHAPSETRIYVASLADYNNGTLHGDWIDANQPPEQLNDQARAMLARSRLPDAEEWAIHDHEGFDPLRLSEYESFETISRLASGIAEHGDAYAHWANYIGTAEQKELDRFEDAYLGAWKSVEDYAEHVLDDLGYIDEINNAIPEHLQPYITIDSASFGRDLELSGDIYASDTSNGTIHLFDVRG